ncbi:MAG TPA: peptidoglycan-binding protein [Bradyrhizobium sp.]|nr:peptidoglycan-binding protein [Bradyrhizobium sp.]
MPRKIAGDDDMPRRRRPARAVAIEVDAERSLALRVLLHSPKDTIAGALALAVMTAIIVNALFLQAGRHPSPMFGSVVVMPVSAPAQSNPLPRARPTEADASPIESKLAEPKTVEPKPTVEPKTVELKTVEPKATEPKDPLANLVKATSALPVAPANIARPPAPIPVSSRSETIVNPATRRVAAVQRALTEHGYGQLKLTGIAGSDTRAAIQKFELDRKLPVTGQVSDRLVRELAAMIGHPVE